MRASFEETTDVLCNAAMFAESENARGVSTSIMTGQLAEFGTGKVGVLLPQSANALAAPVGRGGERVLRSTCRSHTKPEAMEVLEYVPDDTRSRAARPLSPPTAENAPVVHKRVRFRPRSPEP